MSWLSLRLSGMARVNNGSHSFTFHPHVYPQVEWAIPAFTPRLQSVTALWLVLISRTAEGRRLSWPGRRLSCVFCRTVLCHSAAPLPVCIGCNRVWRWYVAGWHRSISHTGVGRRKPVSDVDDGRHSAACCRDRVQQRHNWSAEGSDAHPLQRRRYDGNV